MFYRQTRCWGSPFECPPWKLAAATSACFDLMNVGGVAASPRTPFSCFRSQEEGRH